MNDSRNPQQHADAVDDDFIAEPDHHGLWDFGDLDGYIREGEPGQAERAENWQVAIGLQAVDGLRPSDYLLQTAKEHIEGRISIDDAQRRISEYYEQRSGCKELGAEREADVVSSRITELLGERAFTFSPVELCSIHRRLFDQVLPRAGKYRTYNITKKEWVLKGDSVYYATCDTIAETLRYDFAQERGYSYAGLANSDVTSHLARFVSGVWQVHPFGEGNTRTTAVFAIKYLRTLGFTLDNEPFKQHSWYFRNSLVRANYEDVTRGIKPTTLYLERFFDNVLYGGQHELRNRYLHLDWDEWRVANQEVGRTSKETGTETVVTSKEISITDKEITDISQGTSKEMRVRILSLLREEPTSTAVAIAEIVGLTPQGVRYHLDGLKRAGIISHEGPTKKGRWVIHEQD